MPALPPDLTQPPIDEATLDAELHLFDPDPAGTGLDADAAAAANDLTSGDRARWTVTDTGSAEWAMRQVAAARDAIVDAETQASEFHKQVSDWHRAQIAEPTRRGRFFEHHLVEHLRRLQDAEPDPKRRPKSLSLPSGSVTSRTPTKPAIVVTKPEEVEYWVMARLADQLCLRLVSALAEADAPSLADALPGMIREALAEAWTADPVVRASVELNKTALNHAAAVVPDPTWPEDTGMDAPLVAILDDQIVPGVAGEDPVTTYGVKPK